MRIAPFQRMFAHIDWERAAKSVGRLGATFSFVNVAVGFRSSVSDGVYASADWAVGLGLAFVPYAGIPFSIMYSAHGGTKAVANEIKSVTGQCRKP